MRPLMALGPGRVGAAALVEALQIPADQAALALGTLAVVVPGRRRVGRHPVQHARGLHGGCRSSWRLQRRCPMGFGDRTSRSSSSCSQSPAWPPLTRSSPPQFVEKSAPVAVYASGKGSSAACLTLSVTRNSNSKMRQQSHETGRAAEAA